MGGKRSGRVPLVVTCILIAAPVLPPYPPELADLVGGLEQRAFSSLGFDPHDSGDPVRQRVAQVAADLGLLITHDAGDEILDW